MNTTAETPDNGYWNKTNIAWIGYLLLAISALIYYLVESVDTLRDAETFPIFILHYMLALGYAVVLFVNHSFGIRLSWRRENLDNTVILLNLFLVSAYALNRDIPVFEDSTDWLCVYLIITSGTLLSFRYVKFLPRWINAIQYVLLGTASVLYLYLTLYVANVYAVGTIGIIAFGVGAHIFVPLTLFVTTLIIVISPTIQSVSRRWVVAGYVLPVIAILFFTAAWNKRIQVIEKVANQSVIYGSSDLPIWISVSQRLPMDWISERVVKSDLVYTTATDKFGDWLFMPSTLSWQETRKQDPLVFVASIFSECPMKRDDKIKLLQASAERHRAQERLWSGDNLITSYIISDIDIYPDLRIAYTEKYLNIKNNSKENRQWGTTEEAIYTFQLPEGSVVTSLSLWINDKEEKAILTSKQKAKAAYDTIVGVQRRDPSIIQWQEGNTVLVRVFPCTLAEERKFKIGITSPLSESKGSTTYKGIIFKGPYAGKATETTRIRFHGSPGKIDMPQNFARDKKGDYVSEQQFDPDFELSFPSVPLKADNHFVFDGFDYSINTHKATTTTLPDGKIYLDINTSWTDNELADLIQQLSRKEVFVYVDDEFIRLSQENRDIVNDLQKRDFSLFPFHKLEQPDQSLVITKGKPLSIQLSDLKGSKFAEDMGHFFASGKKVHLYNLGMEISTYISSLRELRAFEFAQGDTQALSSWLKDHQYPQTIENDQVVVLHDANIEITKKEIADTALKSNSPDHLARLFAYNDVLRKVGVSYFKDDFINEALVAEAAKAYVVSPVSSLIVLESKEDYERFDIKDVENSLHNASKDSSGAVPEPHEWALIVLFMLFVLFVLYRNGK